jgi:hypothetical protein
VVGDYLDEIIARRSAQNPDIPKLVDRAVGRRRLQYAQQPPENGSAPVAPGLRAETPIVPATPKRVGV